VTEVSIQYVANALARKRGERGLREVAKAIGISPSTVSRIENGKMPDLVTFRRVCEWLGFDAAHLMTGSRSIAGVSVHFKKDQAIDPKTALALSELIIAAQKQLKRDVEFPAHGDDVHEGP